MKKQSSYITVLLCMIFFTTACMPSEQREPVVKNAIQMTAEEKPSTKEEQTKEVEEVLSTPIKQIVDAPDSIDKKFNVFDEKLKVTIKSDIEIPDVSVTPIFNVTPADFTQETVDGLINVLFEGKKILEINETPIDKSDIKQQMDTIKRLMSKEVEGYEEESKDENEQWLERLELLYESAPDEEEIEFVESDGKLKLKTDKWIPREETDIWGSYCLFVRTHADYNQSQSFSVMNNVNQVTADLSETNKTYNNSYLTYYDNTQGNSYDESGNGYYKAYDEMELDNDELAATLAFKPSDAVSYVEEFFESAGRGDIKVHSIFIKDNEQKGNVDDIVADATEYYYEIFMQRVVNDIPYTSDLSAIKIDKKIIWENERIVVKVNQSGIFNIEWHSPIEIGGIIVQEIPLVKYEEIESNIEKYIEQTYEGYVEGLINDSDIEPYINIDQVAFEYLRIPVKGIDGKEAVAIPVWNFYGTAVFDQYGVDNPQEPEVILSINAMHGSLITKESSY